MPKTLIVFAYFETSSSIANLNFFCKKGLFNSNEHDFIFVIQGKKISYNIPVLPNVTILKKANKGHDFGAWGHALNHINTNEYDYFIFINSTARGPFLPRWVPDTIKWPSLFTDKIKDKYKLVGTTINYNVKVTPKDKPFWAPHIQSMFFCTDKTGLKVMIEKNIFVVDESGKTKLVNKHNLIRNNEVRLSTEFLNAGWELYAMQLSEQSNRKIYESKKNLNKLHGDICYMSKYYGITLNPFEVIFIKTNRIKDKVVDNYSKWLLA